MLSLKLSNVIEHRLADLAKRTGKTKIYCIKKAIENFIEDQEDYLDYQSRIKSKGKTYSLTEVEQLLGLDS